MEVLNNGPHMTDQDIHQAVQMLIENAAVVCSKMPPGDEGLILSLDVCLKSIRNLRNACAFSTKNQDSVMTSGSIETVLRLMEFVLESSGSESMVVLLRCSIQLLTNVCTGQDQAQVHIWNCIYPRLLLSVLKMSDTRASQYSCALMKTCILNADCLRRFTDGAETADVVECVLTSSCTESDHDFSLQFVQTMLQLSGTVPPVFERLEIPSQIILLNIASACAEGKQEELDGVVHPRSVSESTLMCFANRFKCLACDIQGATVTGCHEDEKPQLMMSLLEFLCAASAQPRLQHSVQNIDFILETSIELLGMSTSYGGASVSVNPAGHSLDERGNETPLYGFKRFLVQLIGNLCFKHSINQDKVRELNGIPLILQQCNIDDKNPFINEWAVLAIRNLCEGNLQNQAFIAGLRIQGVAKNDTLEKLGIEPVLKDGGLCFNNTKRK